MANQLYSVRIKFVNNFELDFQWAKRTLLLTSFTAPLIYSAFKSTLYFRKRSYDGLHV